MRDRFFAFATAILLPVDLLELDELKPTLVSAWRVVYWYTTAAHRRIASDE
jgi:hypothetical protein